MTLTLLYCLQRSPSSSHGGGGARRNQTTSLAVSGVASAGGSDEQTTKQMNIDDDEFAKDDGQDVTLSNDVVGATRPASSHGSMSSLPGQRVHQQHADNDPRLMLFPPPSAFLSPPPYPYRLCSPPYVTPFPLPSLYPVRPRPMTHSQMTPSFDGLQPGGSAAGLVGVDNRPLIDGSVASSLWRSVVVSTPHVHQVDQVEAPVTSSADCRDVVANEELDNEQIDVDTVDDLTPPPQPPTADEHLHPSSLGWYDQGATVCYLPE